MKSEIGVSEENRRKVADVLNTLLADETVLYIKTRNYHWNVTGSHFFGLHSLFESQYEELAVMIDDIAERVRQLGHFAMGTMTDYLKLTRLLETSHGDLTDNAMLKNLVNDHETLIRVLREDVPKSEDYRDVVSADFITGLAEKHEKMVWMLRSSISR